MTAIPPLPGLSSGPLRIKQLFVHKRRVSHSRYSFAEPPKQIAPNAEISSIPSIQTLSQKDYILKIAKTDNDEALKYNYQVRFFLQKNPNMLVEVSKDDDIISALLEKIDSSDDNGTLDISCKFVYPFFKSNPSGFIDNGLFFNLRDKMEKFPHAVLDFYQVVPVISGYARDAMISLGIINDIIDYIKNAKTSDDRVRASKVLQAQFRIPEPFQVEDIRDLIPSIISLLESDDKSSTSLVLLSLSEINGRDQVFTKDFINYNLHEYLVQHMEVPELSSSCFTLAGNMSICDSEDIIKMIKCGLIDKIASLLNKHPSDVYWCLSNCFESAPDAMFKALIDYIPNAIKDDSDDARGFIASVLLFSSAANLKKIIDLNPVDRILSIIDASDDELSAKSLDALSRLLILNKNNQFDFDVKAILDSEQMKEKLTKLSKSRNRFIKEVTSHLIEELNDK